MLFCMLPEEAEVLILPAKMLTQGVSMCFTAYCVAVTSCEHFISKAYK